MNRRTPLGRHVLNRILDGRYGIVQDLREGTIVPNGPEVFVYGAKAANTLLYFPVKCNENNSGAGLTRRAAVSAAVGETIERYCSAGWDASDLN